MVKKFFWLIRTTARVVIIGPFEEKLRITNSEKD